MLWERRGGRKLRGWPCVAGRGMQRQRFGTTGRLSPPGSVFGTGEGNAFPYKLRGCFAGSGGWAIMRDAGVHEMRSLMPRREKARRKLRNRVLGEVKLRCECATRWVVIRLAADLDWGRPGGRPYQWVPTSGTKGARCLMRGPLMSAGGDSQARYQRVRAARRSAPTSL